MSINLTFPPYGWSEVVFLLLQYTGRAAKYYNLAALSWVGAENQALLVPNYKILIFLQRFFADIVRISDHIKDSICQIRQNLRFNEIYWNM